MGSTPKTNTRPVRWLRSLWFWLGIRVFAGHALAEARACDHPRMSAESYSGASVAAFFDQYGRREWERLDRDARGRLIHSLHEHFLEGSLRVDVRVLDAGCGAGRFALQCARAGARLTLLDISPTQLELARTQLADLRARIEDAIVADITDLSMLASAQFDLTLCYGSVLSYLVDEGERGLSELVRVTRPGGRVVLSVGSRLGLFRFAAGRPGLDAAGFFGRPEHWLIDRVLETGTLPVHPEVEHPARHFYTSEELRGLMTRCGLVELELATAPALTGGMFERLTEIESSARAWATLRSLEERCYREPGLLDAGDFILARGTVRGR